MSESSSHVICSGKHRQQRAIYSSILDRLALRYAIARMPEHYKHPSLVAINKRVPRDMYHIILRLENQMRRRRSYCENYKADATNAMSECAISVLTFSTTSGHWEYCPRSEQAGRWCSPVLNPFRVRSRYIFTDWMWKAFAEVNANVKNRADINTFFSHNEIALLNSLFLCANIILSKNNLCRKLKLFSWIS